MKILVWADIETTGMNKQNDSILEIYLRATTYDLETISEFESPVYVPSVILDGMDAFCKKMYTKNGLIADILAGNCKTRNDISFRMQEFFKGLPGESKDRTIAGRNIDFDTAFLFRDYPWMKNLLHYQKVDLSVYRTTVSAASGLQFFHPSDLNKDEQTHRAKQDIDDTIADFKSLRSDLNPGY